MYKTIINTKYLEFEYNGKKIFIVQDHQVALLCWKKALADGLINRDSLLFHIDQHSDCYFSQRNIQKSSQFLDMSNTQSEDFVLNDLSKDSSEYIINGMYSGLIGDGIIIKFGGGSSDWGESFVETYGTTERRAFVDSFNTQHICYYYDSENIKNIIGYQCLIGDTCIHQDTDKTFRDSHSLILNIDLDYFTYANGASYPRHINDIREQIESKSFQAIFNKSKIVTIAIEPYYCNGYGLEILRAISSILSWPTKLEDDAKKLIIDNRPDYYK